MKKGFVFLTLSLICISILGWFYLWRSSFLIPSEKNISSEKNTMDEDYKVQIQNIPMNPVHSILSSFLSINSIEQIQELESRKELNSYILLTQKIISEQNSKLYSEIPQLQEQQDKVFALIFDYYSVNPTTASDFSWWKEEFIKFMREEGLQWKALWQDFELSEIIAGNREYCNNTSTFPTETDKKWCLAQIDFYHSTSLEDCDTIDGSLFPDWKNICNAYYTSTDI